MLMRSLFAGEMKLVSAIAVDEFARQSSDAYLAHELDLWG